MTIYLLNERPHIFQCKLNETSTPPLRKESEFEANNEDFDFLDQLTDRDWRLIARSEEELSRTESFIRLLPSLEYSK